MTSSSVDVQCERTMWRTPVHAMPAHRPAETNVMDAGQEEMLRLIESGDLQCRVGAIVAGRSVLGHGDKNIQHF